MPGTGHSNMVAQVLVATLATTLAAAVQTEPVRLPSDLAQTRQVRTELSRRQRGSCGHWQTRSQPVFTTPSGQATSAANFPAGNWLHAATRESAVRSTADHAPRGRCMRVQQCQLSERCELEPGSDFQDVYATRSWKDATRPTTADNKLRRRHQGIPNWCPPHEENPPLQTYQTFSDDGQSLNATCVRACQHAPTTPPPYTHTDRPPDRPAQRAAASSRQPVAVLHSGQTATVLPYTPYVCNPPVGPAAQRAPGPTTHPDLGAQRAPAPAVSSGVALQAPELTTPTTSTHPHASRPHDGPL